MPFDLLTQETMAMLLAAVSAFAAIIGLTLPSEPNTRLQARLQSVARERDRLREKRLSDLAARSKRKLRKDDADGLLGRLAKAFRSDDSAPDDEIAARLGMAGFRGPGAEPIFRFLRAILPIACFLATYVVLKARPPSSIPPSSVLPLSIAAAAIGFSLPRLVLDRLIARRQRLILRAFPDALDLLLICVQSGMSVEAALAKVTKDISPQSIELAEELSLTMAELSYLPVRWRAYSNLGDRIGLPAVKLITAALVQAERHGTSISQALTAAAREGREARIAEAERKAAALPPKLAVPLVVFFLPVLLTIILAPALMKADEALEQNRPSITTRDLTAQSRHQQDGPSSLQDLSGAAR